MKKDRLAKKFLEELSEVPIVSDSCEKVGISRNTPYRWRREDPVFSKEMSRAMSMGVNHVSDLAESKLIQKIQQGDMAAIKYWLNNRKRNYARPRPKDYWDTKRIEGNIIQLVDMSRDTAKKEKRLEELEKKYGHLMPEEDSKD
ncbi:MAG: phBC6A51 family helix-turn-helix protein [Candidatus Colwellbacteria bacterium]|nr:phBC6A51 family helix-turn-helix protein [Candidatus Colwellbacteria bacterium]